MQIGCEWPVARGAVRLRQGNSLPPVKFDLVLQSLKTLTVNESSLERVGRNKIDSV